MIDGLEAGRARGVQPKRQSAKVPGSGKRPKGIKLRVQYHLDERLIERLGVHASLTHTSHSKVVEKVLGDWLQRYGRGKELWGPDSGEGDPSGDIDRNDAA